MPWRAIYDDGLGEPGVSVLAIAALSQCLADAFTRFRGEFSAIVDRLGMLAKRSHGESQQGHLPLKTPATDAHP